MHGKNPAYLLRLEQKAMKESEEANQRRLKELQRKENWKVIRVLGAALLAAGALVWLLSP